MKAIKITDDAYKVVVALSKEVKSLFQKSLQC